MSSPEFAIQFNQLQGYLQAFAARLTKNDADARDLVQETALKAFRYRDHYQPHTNLKAWLITIMRNTFINEYRRRKRRQVLNDHTGTNFLLDAGGASVLNSGESNLTTMELEKLINEVEDWARIPFMMYYQGHKYDEIADELNIPLGTVKSRIFFARKRMKELIREFYQVSSAKEML